MSMFYCEKHDRMEDSDFEGFYIVDGLEVCDEGRAEMEYEAELVADEDR